MFLSALVNVALGRRTFMSQPIRGRGSSLAVDGNRNSNVVVVGSCSVTHSSRGTKSWWAVDLGVVANVTSVAISQRDYFGKIYLLGKLRSLFSVMSSISDIRAYIKLVTLELTLNDRLVTLELTLNDRLVT